MDLLIFKLIVTPLLLLGASLAVRRWGAAVGGFLVGLPLTSGPISVFLAIERGPDFAVQATSGSLAATAGQAAFCLAYCRVANRRWLVATLAASVAFAGVAAVLQWSGLSQVWLFLVSVLALAVALHMIPKEVMQGNQPSAPWWDLPARMALMASLVVGVTICAPHIGPGLAGVLASFPFMATILGVFAHRLMGPQSAGQVMRGMAAGLFGFAAFFYIVSLTLGSQTLVTSYVLAIVSALILQSMVLHHIRRTRHTN